MILINNFSSKDISSLFLDFCDRIISVLGLTWIRDQNLQLDKILTFRGKLENMKMYIVNVDGLEVKSK